MLVNGSKKYLMCEGGLEHPCTIVYRKDHWKLGNWFPCGIALVNFIFCRITVLSVHKLGESLLLSLLATLLFPIRWGIWTLLETHVKMTLPLAKYNMVPKHGLSNDFSSGLLLEAIPTRILQVAVIGFWDGLLSLYTLEIRCRWVAALLEGVVKFPNIKEMRKDIERWDEYIKQSSGEYYTRSFFGGLEIWANPSSTITWRLGAIFASALLCLIVWRYWLKGGVPPPDDANGPGGATYFSTGGGTPGFTFNSRNADDIFAEFFEFKGIGGGGGSGDGSVIRGLRFSSNMFGGGGVVDLSIFSARLVMEVAVVGLVEDRVSGKLRP
ncbi:N-oxide-forming dimethylaniline monooxygenase [Tanacetum coccineum]